MGHAVTSRTVQLVAADGTLIPAYEASPSERPRGAIVLLQEIFGVNSHIRRVADDYAAEGYLVVAPATFSRIKADVELGYEPQDVAVGRALKEQAEALPAPGTMLDVQAAVDYVAVVGKVAVIGYCWGGLLAWRAAALVPGLAAAVPYYGGGMTGATEAVREPLCPVQAHFGELDQAIPIESVRVFAQQQSEVEVHVYPAQHGFNCDHRGAYHAESAALARQRTLSFLKKHVG
jgi:carboxymethylenebutenolidase